MTLNLKIILIIIVFTLIFCTKKNYEMFGNYKAECDYLPRAIKHALEKRKMKKVKDDSWEYYLPCGYTYCESNVRAFKSVQTGKKLFMIDGCDWIASKVALWQLIKNEFGDKAHTIMPETFVLSDRRDMNNFKKFYDSRKAKNSGCKFILKNFQQRQEGLRLSNNINHIKESVKDGFKIVQDYLENPFIISGRKINLRYYLLIRCQNGKINGWIFNDGFLYYTPEYFEKYSMNFKKTITTGYIDRKVYEVNPLTIKDFRKYLGPEKAKKWDDEVINKMGMVMKALSRQICSSKKLSKHLRFQIFGADLAPDENLNGTLMEINKGPDIGFKDERDGNVKKQMVEDAFNVIDPIEKGVKHEYIKVF
jgi:hypothetical protein